jgi:hypothetical protein
MCCRWLHLKPSSWLAALHSAPVALLLQLLLLLLLLLLLSPSH